MLKTLDFNSDDTTSDSASCLIIFDIIASTNEKTHYLEPTNVALSYNCKTQIVESPI